MIPTLTDVVDLTTSETQPQGATMIGEGAMQVGGHQAHSSVDRSYEGPCTVIADGKAVATLPNAAEAYRAARYAITQDGGYSHAEVELAGDRQVTHPTYQDWAF